MISGDVDFDALSFPEGLRYDIEHQTWARAEADGSVTVGITALGIGLAGEIYMCRPKPAGQAVERGRSLAVVELAKAVVAVKAPVSGSVLEANAAVGEAPELVHSDPYGRGWLLRLAPSDWAQESALLVHGDAVRAAMRQHLAAQQRDEET